MVGVIGSLVIGHVADKVNGRVLGSLTVIATSAVLAGMSFVGELWQVYVLFSVRSVLSVAALEAEWMLVPSFGFQGGHGPTKWFLFLRPLWTT